MPMLLSISMTLIKVRQGYSPLPTMMLFKGVILKASLDPIYVSHKRQGLKIFYKRQG